MYVVLDGLVRIYRDESKNVEMLSKQDIIDLKVLDQAFLTVTGKAEDEQEIHGDKLAQKKLAKMEGKSKVDYTMGTLASQKEENIFKLGGIANITIEQIIPDLHIKARSRGRRNTKINLEGEMESLVSNIKTDINKWGDAAQLSWTNEYRVLFLEQNKNQLKEVNYKQSNFKSMFEMLNKRKEFIMNYYTDQDRAKRTFEAVLRKYLGTCVREMRPGDIFGERALESNAPRSASAVTSMPCE